jgi:hypothetical protein
MKSVLLVYCLLLIFPGVAGSYQQVNTPTPEPPRPMSQFLDRLAAPPTVYPPTQADQGAQVYYLVCMACHGDRGQGLTAEWRGALDPPDQNCWQSRCHAANHPPDGFVFPHDVPPVIGPSMAARFANGLELYQYLKTRMPWQAPGMRSDEEYWQLTAHLLRWNGVDPGSEPLTPERAANLWLNPQAKPSPTPLPASARLLAQPVYSGLALAGLALGIMLLGVYFLVKYRHARRR